MKLLVLVFSYLLVGCTNLKEVGDKEKNPATFVGCKNGNPIYTGGINNASNNVLFSLFNDAELKPNRLIISSNGGDFGAGIDLGNWLKDENLDVEVVGACASSCANYVFPAANNKYLRKDSILIWHGSAWQSQWNVAENNRENFNTYTTLMREKETQFYADIAVDNQISVYGQSKFNFWDYIKELFDQGTVGYDYSLADLEKFGLDNITG